MSLSKDHYNENYAALERNIKQIEVLNEVINNTADFVKPGEGAYQTGFRATLNWSRATGKTYILMDLIAISAINLPGAVGGLWSSTFNSVQKIILSQSSKVWKEYGLTEYEEKVNEYGNYVVNRKPPRHFKKPHITTRNYENTVSFANGYMLKMLSADRLDAQRGDNFDQLFGDEVGFSKMEFYTRILLPGLRANKRVYKDTRPGRAGHNHPLHWLSVLVSSLPYSPKGRWFMNYENLARQNPAKYFFSRANAFDNLENLPGDFIETQRDELSPLEFQVEIENRIVNRLPNGFYPSLDEDKHVITRFTYEFDKALRNHETFDRLYESLRPVDMSWDFNGYFTCCTISQELDDCYVFNNEFYAKESTTTLIERVCDDFIEEYKFHMKKVVYLYGDNSGKNKDPDRNISLFDKIKSKLILAGWTVVDKVQKTYPSFKSRYILENDILSELKPRYPKIRFHAQKCKSLILSLQNADIDKESFEKSKKDEGTKTGVPQELATHFSDAFDYVVYEKFKSFSSVSSSRTYKMKTSSR
jgi:hypothetical protein